MARRKSKRRELRPLVTGKRADVGAVSRTLKHKAVVQLTEAIVALEKSAAMGDVEARVEIGGMLAELRDLLPHGEWLRWLDSDVPFTPRIAQVYMHLHAWAQTHQVTFQRIAPLGASKVYLLMRQPGKVLAALLSQDRHRVPDTGKLRTLEGMTFKELLSVVQKKGGSRTLSAADRALSSYRRRVHALVRATDSLVEHAAALPAPDVRDLAATLREAADALEAEL